LAPRSDLRRPELAAFGRPLRSDAQRFAEYVDQFDVIEVLGG
jgi:hypothetical protein